MEQTNMTRRQFVTLLGAGAALGTIPGAWAKAATPGRPARIKAFCIDFNWMKNGTFAAPGVFAKASPTEHFQWYRELGVNTIQTFCVNCCGYAWYRGSKVAPVTPGLASDFLPEITTLAHGAGMRSMGYFCVGANTYWGKTHPELSHGAPSAVHIPQTEAYLDYLGRSIEDVLRQTDIDGFMIDWIWNPAPKWIDCERQMYVELMQEKFPGAEKMNPARNDEFCRRAMARTWRRIHQAAKSVKPGVILWLCCHKLESPQVKDTAMLRELDWIMNENPDPSTLAATRKAIGPHGKIIQTVCGWGDKHDAAKLMEDLRGQDVGFYGFAAPDPVTTLPYADNAADDSTSPYMAGKLTGNAKNIVLMRKAFHEL